MVFLSLNNRYIIDSMSKEKCPFENTECPYYDHRPAIKGAETGCYADEHHLYWPKPDYSSSNARKFRNSPENKVQLCRWLHDEVHYEEIPERDTSREEI